MESSGHQAPDACGSAPPRMGLTALLLVLATGLALAIRLARLAANPDPLGTDGFYYVVQIEDLLAVLLAPTRSTWHWLVHWLVAGLLALAVASAHRMGAGLLLAAGLGAGRGWWLGPRRRNRPAGRDWLALGVLAAVLMLFIGASLALPGLLHPADLERFSGQFDLRLTHPAPFAWFHLRATHPVQQIELLWSYLALGLAVWAWIRRPADRPVLGALALPLAICLFPFWRRDELDLGYRLWLMGPLLAAPLTLLAVPAWSHRLGRHWLVLVVGCGLRVRARRSLGALARLRPAPRRRGSAGEDRRSAQSHPPAFGRPAAQPQPLWQRTD